MSYSLGFLGQASAETRAVNRRHNEESGVATMQVGPGYWDDWIDAAIEPRGIGTAEAGRVPGAIREVLEAAGEQVDTVCWGGGSGCGGESTRGKIYVRWKPGRPFNAVTYADIARNLFASAADQFTAGSQLMMFRYRIPGGWFSSDKYVYPEGGPIPASAPAAAQRTTSQTPPVEPAPSDLLHMERALSEQGPSPLVWVALGVGGTVVLGAGYYLYRRRHTIARMRRNVRRRRRTSR